MIPSVPALAVIGSAVFLMTVHASQQPAPGSPREAHAVLAGVRLWYRDSGGAGVPVVFMHAATGSSRVWEHQEAAFTAAGYRFIAYDRRGFGRTIVDAGAPPGTGAKRHHLL